MNTVDILHRLVEEELELSDQIEALRSLTLDRVDLPLLVEAIHLFREQMIPVDIDQNSVDMAGTGGDRSGTFNISTTSAIVASAAEVPIAKHGNVSISSKSGGVDLLRALNIDLPETAGAAQKTFQDHNCVFLFAQKFHPIFAKFIPARRALAAHGVITIFNILGPLLNPASVRRQICGVFQPNLVELMAHALLETSTKRGLVVYGNGLDEFSISGENKVAEIHDGKIDFYTKSPKDLGFKTCDIEELKGGLPDENATITNQILSGEITGPKKDIVALNAGAAIYLGSDDLSFKEAINKANEAIESGAALLKLESLSS